MNKLVTITGPNEQPLLRAHEWDFKDSATLAQVDWWSSRMAKATVLPDHLKVWVDENGAPITNMVKWRKDNPKALFHQDTEATAANLMLVVSQAFAWNMPPQQLAQACFVARGKLGYEGKLIQALIEREVGNLDVEYSGKGDALTAVVTGPRPGDGKRVSISGSLAEWATKNDDGGLTPQWRGGEHKQRMMMRYRGVREWARAHAPHLVLGIVGDDEMEALQEDFRARRAVDISSIPSPPKSKPPTPLEDPPPPEPPPGGGPTYVSSAGYRVEGDADHTGPGAPPEPPLAEEGLPEHFTVREEEPEPSR